MHIYWMQIDPLPLDVRYEQNGNLEVFLSGIGDTCVTLKANAKKIFTVKCMWHHICTKPLFEGKC